MFGMFWEMIMQDICELVDGFVCIVKLFVEVGFVGVEIYVVYGYFLDQFFLLKVNKCIDDYGVGLVIKGVKVVVEIIEVMRVVVFVGFCIGIKLNLVDYQFLE